MTCIYAAYKKPKSEKSPKHNENKALDKKYSKLMGREKKRLLRNTYIRSENQDGGVGRHTAPPRTTRTDRKS